MPLLLPKIQAATRLHKQIDEIQEVKKSLPSSPLFVKWRRDTEVVIQSIFGEATRHIIDFTNVFVLLDYTNEYNEYAKIMDKAKAILESLHYEIQQSPDTLPTIPRNEILVIEKICRRFHLVVRQLRDRYAERATFPVEDEYDVQDLFHALLVLDFDDIRPEEYTPSYAGSSARTDFLLKQEQIVVEIKKTRKDLIDKQVGEQLSLDIQKYKGHPDCRTLVCFVYDPDGRIANPRGLENDLNRSDHEITVKVIIAPSGV